MRCFAGCCSRTAKLIVERCVTNNDERLTSSVVFGSIKATQDTPFEAGFAEEHFRGGHAISQARATIKSIGSPSARCSATSSSSAAHRLKAGQASVCSSPVLSNSSQNWVILVYECARCALTQTVLHAPVGPAQAFAFGRKALQAPLSAPRNL